MKRRPEKFHSLYVVKCRAVSDAHICASFLSYLHHSTVVTVDLAPKQDWQLPRPQSERCSPQGPTSLPPATLSEHFFSPLSQCNTALVAISHSACHASQCIVRAEQCLLIVQKPVLPFYSVWYSFRTMSAKGDCSVEGFFRATLKHILVCEAHSHDVFALCML